MKNKLAIVCFIFIISSVSIFAQNNVSVEVSNPIYDIIDIAQVKGLCGKLSGARPYTQKRILEILDEILEHSDSLSETEIKIINGYIKESEIDYSEKNKFGASYFTNNSKSIPIKFGLTYSFGLETGVGLYNKSDYNAFAFDFVPQFALAGDFGDFLGFNFNGVFDFAKIPLHKAGDDYYIGTNWFNSHDDSGAEVLRGSKGNRTIPYFENNAWLPYTHIYSSSGQYYWVNKLIPSSLGSLKEESTAYGNFYSEIRANFLDDMINIGFGRISREWAAMDKSSSLVLNRTAVPFYGLDFSFNVSSWLSYSFITGSLENPNRGDIYTSSWMPDRDHEDSYFFQNAFSLQMLELTLGNLHIDFGSSVVYPKRFELGYLFPLTVLVEYQNHVGDYDNVAMFGDIKYTLPGYGSVWASLFTDEINDFSTNPFTGTREMFAIQAGIKAVVPKVPFGSITMRYTKIEPYCYTHHSINYVPYYDHYVCENYTNNGLCIGSYLPPNTDEILIRFDAQPFVNISTSIAYQLTRHGAEFGNQQVPGSSLVSELDNKNRDDFHKYFLHDGAYNWIHAISAQGSYYSRQTKVPFKIDASLGLVISYYTGIDQSSYDSVKDEHGKQTTNNMSTKYSIIDTDEYPFKVGPVFSIGITIGKF